MTAARMTVDLSDFADDARTAYADSTALRQVLGNLVDNAVRHTTSGHVTLFSRRHERGVIVGVRDSGVGIPPEHLPRIFERFYRVDPGRARDQAAVNLLVLEGRHAFGAPPARPCDPP